MNIRFDIFLLSKSIEGGIAPNFKGVLGSSIGNRFEVGGKRAGE
jgi:hypothetical protein